MNIAKSFSDYMATNSYGVLGTSLFIGSVPQSAPSTCWWVVSAGGAPTQMNQTAELQKEYIINVFYRNIDAEQVYENMQSFEELINSPNCEQLTGFDTIEMRAVSFPTDQDIDSQERTVGLVQVNIRTYYKE